MGKIDHHNHNVPKWYFGGMASVSAAMFTHPLDLVKVHMQTSQHGKLTVLGQAKYIFKREGIRGLYSGISASILRQSTYSLTRFALYGEFKKYFNPTGKKKFTFLEMAAMSGTAGFVGGVVGTPADMMNVRMQNDINLPKDKRRNYKHALDGLYRVYKEEGPKRLFSGITFASIRAAAMTLGQLTFYEEVKEFLLDNDRLEDNIVTHFISSLAAGAGAVLLTQPLDVLKTRKMNSKPNEYKGIADIVTKTAKLGPTAFYKGVVPAFLRLGPQTILQFIFFEQLRIRFGTLPHESSK